MQQCKSVVYGRSRFVINCVRKVDISEMEKGKKEKKGRNEKESRQDVVSDEEIQAPVPTKASKKKEKKAKKNEVEDSDEEAQQEIPMKTNAPRFMMLDVEDVESTDEGENSEEEQKIVSKSSQRKAKKNAKANQVSAVENSVEDAEEKSNNQPKKEKKGKTSKKGKEDEDIDAILAELSLKNNGASTDKKDKKKKGAKNVPENVDNNQDTPASSSAALTIENHLMTQDEIAKKMEEMYPSSDDEKKGKKKKNKKQKGGEKGKAENDVNDEEGTPQEVVKTGASSQKNKNDQKQANENGVNKESDVHEAAGKPQDLKSAGQKKKESKTEPKVASKSEVPTKDSVSEATSAVAVKESTPTPDSSEARETTPAHDDGEGEDGEGGKKSKKDKRKKKNEKEKKEEEKKEKKPPQSKLAQKILEQQRLIREEEERIRREEEERIRREEEADRLREEKARLEKEKKDREKQKKKDRIERQKQEGTYLTPEQREKKRRALAMLEALKNQGAEIPAVPATGAAASAEGEQRKPKKVVYENKKKKKPQQADLERQESDAGKEATTPEAEVSRQLSEEASMDTADEVVTAAEVEQQPAVVEEESIKEAWDESSEEEEEEEEDSAADQTTATKHNRPEAGKVAKKESDDEDDEDSDEDDDDEETDSDEDSDSSSSDEDDGKTVQERAREKAAARIKARKEQANALRSLSLLRAPVVCVLGHVDTGKTKILDKLRRTNVQDGEAGGITQQIGATNVPQDTIREQTKMCKEFSKVELRLPGLLIIDTPGHESFSNLRNRGSSLCDIAILVVDIMHGLEPQTKESIELLRQKKTPFVVALNKVDRLNEWQPSPHTDIITTINKQKQSSKLHFEDRVKRIIVEFAELGLNVTLFNQNKDTTEYISMVPTSAHSGDGMGNLIAQICELTQTTLAERLMYSDNLEATVMEVKAIPGHGTTIDVILVNGTIREGETIIVAGQEGPIVTQIRALLMPQPLRELRVKSSYEHHKEVRAAQGCKIAAKDLEKALAGLPLFVAHQPDEVEIYRDELSQMLEDVLGSIKVQERGVFVQASTLGSLEALLVFLTSSKIPYAGISIGPVHKRDVMKASVMLEHDPQYAVILAFDVKVERDAQEMADGLEVKIFCADIIYHLFDRFTKYREEWMHKKQEEFKHLAIFPCKLRIYPENVFKTRDPIVVGVNVEAGFLKEGTMLCVPSKEFLEVGRVTSIEVNHKTVQKAAKGQDVCIKIDSIPGEAPKMYGRHFDNTDLLVSKISRESIDVVKNYFREEMTKADWQLVLELKKTFAIL